MYSRAQLNELGAKVNSATKELEILKSENIRLQTELEEKISLKNVEEYATVELGNGENGCFTGGVCHFNQR